MVACHVKRAIALAGPAIVQPSLLRSIEDVKEFVNTVSKIEGDATLSGGRYIVDAKSIMGIFSLDLTKQLKQDMVSCF